MNLSASETRVLGCMLEKELTTPDIYPLTLNSLRLACNQSTNRDPVVEYDDGVLRDALHHLERRGFTRLASGRGSRAPKYRHLLAEALPLTGDEQAVMSVLMLRGPQTPGELKQRAERMHSFADLAAVHEPLDRLIARGLVACLERRPGQKEDRYTQLLEDREAQEHADGAPLTTGIAPAVGSATGASSHATPSAGAGPPIDGLEERVARLEREVAALRADVVAQEHIQRLEPLSDTGAVLDNDPEPSPEPASRAWS
jgi:uncharacterized protein YceH (UPF0502 family)